MNTLTTEAAEKLANARYEANELHALLTIALAMDGVSQDERDLHVKKAQRSLERLNEDWNRAGLLIALASGPLLSDHALERATASVPG